MGKGSEQTFLLRRQINGHMKRCSTSLVMRQMQIKTTLRYHFAHIRWQESKKWTTTNDNIEKLDPSYTVYKNVK